MFFSKNTKDHIVNQLSSELGIARTSDLGLYLRVPLLHTPMTKVNFQFLIDRVKKKLSGWKADSLSFAGRVALAQSCLLSLPTYIMQTTPIPAGICMEIESLCKNFI